MIIVNRQLRWRINELSIRFRTKSDRKKQQRTETTNATCFSNKNSSFDWCWLEYHSQHLKMTKNLSSVHLIPSFQKNDMQRKKPWLWENQKLNLPASFFCLHLIEIQNNLVILPIYQNIFRYLKRVNITA